MAKGCRAAVCGGPDIFFRSLLLFCWCGPLLNRPRRGSSRNHYLWNLEVSMVCCALKQQRFCKLAPDQPVPSSKDPRYGKVCRVEEFGELSPPKRQGQQGSQPRAFGTSVFKCDPLVHKGLVLHLLEHPSPIRDPGSSVE